MEISMPPWKIRSWSLADRPALVKYANNRNIWRNLRDNFPHPYTQPDADQYLHSVLNQNPESHFAIASAQEAIGAIGLMLQSGVSAKSAEIGYWLGEPFWGQGIATAALRAMVEFGFIHFDIVRIYAEVFEWNPASMRVLEKAGFRCEGRLRKSVFKDGHLIDKVIYAVIRD
jgi:ribosomal-protein-alanine N-acetyltransferase